MKPKKTNKDTVWEPLLRFVAEGLELAKRKTSSGLMYATRHLGPRGWKLTLTSFCLLSAIAFSWSVLDSFTPKQNHQAMIVRPAVAYGHIGSSIPLEHRASYLPPVSITRFRRYLDSLEQSPGGKQIMDSLITNRPGLIDSLQHVETLYQY